MDLRQFKCVQCEDDVILDLDQFPQLPDGTVFSVLCTPCLERGIEEGRQVRAPN